jgi:hypothetical protein
MNTTQIEINLKNLIAKWNKETFIFDLLLAYGLPKASITLLKKGNRNMSKTEGEISWKKKLFFREEQNADLHITLSELAKNLTHNERFVIVTDYKTLLAIDTKTDDKLDCPISDLPKHYDFFLPWAGMEKAQHKDENPADVKAAEKMAKLFDVIKKDNPDNSPEFIHGLNVFLSRLLFCFFAEDTYIFNENQFTNALDSHTQADGSDLSNFFNGFFKVLNTPKDKRANFPDYLNAFPFVNGGLFEKQIAAPNFSRKSRAAVIQAGEQNWSAINPDIFGSMFQAVIGADQRGNLGQHYTSVPNIMKVIEPLFLNELYEEFEKHKANERKLNELLVRISKLKIFDPACGSGNFLIIAYKELRSLEMKILKQIEKLSNTYKTKLSQIQLSQFYGIEIDDFAGEIAKLSLWLAEHQMNIEFEKEFGKSRPTLPLSEAGHIVQGNACRLNWEAVCPKNEGDEIYILGNPPYLGARNQNSEQKEDIEIVLNNVKGSNNLDYIACWFYLGAKYCTDSKIKAAFVTTNSICQGSQVPLLWNPIFSMKQKILFAHQAFRWTNNAKEKAGVICAIIGLGQNNNTQRALYKDNFKRLVKNISPYLIESSDIAIESRNITLSSLPEMVFGSMPNDSGNLILSEQEKNTLIRDYPNSEAFIKRFLGSSEYIRGNERFCLWVDDNSVDEAISIPPIKERIENVKTKRLASKRDATKKLAVMPYRFGEIRHQHGSSIIIPSVSSERREYIPIGYLDDKTVISNLALAIYNSKPWILSVLLSKMHNVWVKSIGGYLGTSIRYSVSISYNTFPFPPISTQRKNEITQSAFRILEEREKHSDKTLAQLYDPDKMPESLREAHRQNDIIIEKCYRSTPFKSDEERLEYLFKLYEKMIAEEQNKNTLFAKEKKSKKSKKQ